MSTKKKEDYAELAGMSEIHKAALERAGQSWQEANAKGDQKGMDAAHAAAESIRGLYGYSGGEDGSQYVSTQAAPKTTSKSTPSYINQYQGAINQAANALMNRVPFTYDPNTDPTYQQYADSYTRMGKQAMEDTLAKVSARTGGLASSYAGTAAQQAYNGYMSALADKVPELRQLAYQMYMDEGDAIRQNLSMLQGLENTAYGRYRDSVADNQWQKTFDYNAAQDALAQNNYLAEWAYKKDQDDKKWTQQATQDAQKQVQEHIAAGGKVEELPQELVTASGYSPAQWAAWEKEYADAKSLAAAQLMEGTGDYSRYAQLYGLSDEEVAALVKQFQEQNAPKVTGDRGGDLSMTLTTAKAMAKQGQFTDEVLRVLRNAGFNDEYLKLEYGYEPVTEVEPTKNDAALDGLYQRIVGYIENGSKTAAEIATMLEKSALSDTQKGELLTMLGY